MPDTPSQQSARPVAVLGGNRIPFARSNGPYAQASNQDMLIAALDGLVARFGLGGETVDEVVAGAVLKHSRDFNLVRECVMGSALDDATPGYDVQQACDTGIQAAILAANKIALGQADCAIAGGVDTTSDAPLGVNDDLRRLLVKANATKSNAERIKLLAHVRPGHLVPDMPRNAEPRTGLSMGEHAAITARRWGIGREAQDELAAASHQRLAAAYGRGVLAGLVPPFLGLERCRNPRPAPGVGKPPRLARALGPPRPAPWSDPVGAAEDGCDLGSRAGDARRRQPGCTPGATACAAWTLLRVSCVSRRPLEGAWEGPDERAAALLRP